MLKFCALFSNFHSPNSPSNLNPVDFKLQLSLIQPSDETCGFRPYLSCYLSHERKMWAKVTPAWAAKLTLNYLLGHKCKTKWYSSFTCLDS